MAAPDSTKYQINYKLADGTLINLYATDVRELESGLADLGMVASLIKSTGAELGGGSALATAVANVAQVFPGATPVSPSAQFSTPPAPVAQDGSKQCRHGAMVWKEGVSQKGPWKAWMCAAPKGAPDKCDAIWIR
jgi:hypothetical protein